MTHTIKNTCFFEYTISPLHNSYIFILSVDEQKSLSECPTFSLLVEDFTDKMSSVSRIVVPINFYFQFNDAHRTI